MRILFRLVLLTTLTLISGVSIAQNKNSKYKAFYKKINKDFRLPQNKANQNNSNPDCLDSLLNNIKTLESSIKQLEKILDAPRPEREPDDRPEKRIIYNSDKGQESKPISPPATKPSTTPMPKPTPRLSITSNTAPKAETLNKQTQPTTTVTTTQPSLTEPSQPTTSSKPATTPTPSVTSATSKSKSTSLDQILNSLPEIRNSSIKLERGTDIKKYNVIVATMSTLQRASRLKAILFTETDDKTWIAKSEQDLHHLIIGSYDTEEEAVNKRNSIIRNYTSKYSDQDLMNKYGIPFTDIWILVKN